MNSSEIPLALSNVSFEYEAHEFTLNSINFEARSSRVTGLLGPNGAGKTTLIHIMCGLLKPKSGHITHLNKRIEDTFSFKSKVGFVPQYDGLFNELTLAENLTYFGRLYDMSQAKIESQIRMLTDALQMTPHLHKRLKFFSGGMNRRANIICALLHGPEIIILDEPTSGVDIQSRHIIHQLITQLKSEQKTIIYTSHLLKEAEDLCDYYYIIDGGQVIAEGDMTNIQSGPNRSSLQDLFLDLTGKLARD